MNFSFDIFIFFHPEKMVKIKRLVRNNLDYKTEKRREANRIRQKKVDSVWATLTLEDFKYIESEGVDDYF